MLFTLIYIMINFLLNDNLFMINKTIEEKTQTALLYFDISEIFLNILLLAEKEDYQGYKNYIKNIKFRFNYNINQYTYLSVLYYLMHTSMEIKLKSLIPQNQIYKIDNKGKHSILPLYKKIDINIQNKIFNNLIAYKNQSMYFSNKNNPLKSFIKKPKTLPNNSFLKKGFSKKDLENYIGYAFTDLRFKELRMNKVNSKTNTVFETSFIDVVNLINDKSINDKYKTNENLKFYYSYKIIKETLNKNFCSKSDFLSFKKQDLLVVFLNLIIYSIENILKSIILFSGRENNNHYLSTLFLDIKKIRRKKYIKFIKKEMRKIQIEVINKYKKTQDIDFKNLYNTLDLYIKDHKNENLLLFFKKFNNFYINSRYSNQYINKLSGIEEDLFIIMFITNISLQYLKNLNKSSFLNKHDIKKYNIIYNKQKQV